MKRSRNADFSILELAVVLIIVSLLLGSTFAVFQSMMSQVERRETTHKIEQLRESITAMCMIEYHLQRIADKRH